MLKTPALICWLICLSVMPAKAQYGGGSGTAADPYLIYTAEQMQEIGANSDDWDKHFELMSDIDLSGYAESQFNIIGQVWTAFSGVFDGNNHKIFNFTYNTADTPYIGLFRSVEGANAKIKNLGLINPQVDGGTGNNIGSLVGVSRSGAIISNCYVVGGGVSGRQIIGGLVAQNVGTGKIWHCWSSASVSALQDTSDAAGGLLGFNSGTVSNCYSCGSVSSRGIFHFGSGGLVGANVGTIFTCFSSVAVTREGESTGGLAGYNRGTMVNCYASSEVRGDSIVGGLVGWNEDGAITNCYSHGTVSGNTRVGGLVGLNSGRAAEDSFWDIESSAQETSASGTGKTTAQMQIKSTFTSAGWDFTTPIWKIREGEYPRLWWEVENSAPVADAGNDQTVFAWINGLAEVTLDGSDSYDNDGDDLTYTWCWNIDANSVCVTGISPTIELSCGEHTIELVVNDGLCDSDPDVVVISVVPPIELSMKLTPQTLNIFSQGKWVKAHFVLPAEYALEDIDCNSPAVLEPLAIESNYIYAFINEDELVELKIAFDRAAVCVGLENSGPFLATVIASFTNGQHFYGTDTITIINNHLEALAILSSNWMNTTCAAPDWCAGADINCDSTVNLFDFVRINAASAP